MLNDSPAFSTFAVPDLEAARRFYGQTLGLDVRDAEMGVLDLHIPGSRPVTIYPKPDHQPATYTVLNFPVSDIDAAVDRLNGAGIQMERYDDIAGGAEMQADDKGVYRGQGPAIAWFKDPAGNILSVMEMGAA